MKKDIDKLFSESLHTYYFLLVVIVIIKLLGSNWFDIVEVNSSLIMINDFILKFKLEWLWYFITLYLNVLVVLSITTNKNNKRLKIYAIFVTLIAMVFQILKSQINAPLFFVICDGCYMFVFSMIYLIISKIKITKNNIFNYINIIAIINILQLVSIFIRSVDITNTNNFIIYFILNLDFLLSILIIYKLYFQRGGESLWEEEVYFGSQKLISLKSLLKNLQIKLQNKHKLNKKEKIVYSIYMPLYLLWNLFTMVIICLIAKLNNALIESLFITIAFWINKRSFGKPFHFKKVMTCFCFSSIVYYGLTRITFSIQSSIFIPIFLGVSLSYITSHFIMKDTELYRGMPEEIFYDTIKQVTDNELTIKMCKEFYCDRFSDKCIGMRYNYSSETVRKKRREINTKLKDLAL